jgi:hypothetical protein
MEATWKSGSFRGRIWYCNNSASYVYVYEFKIFTYILKLFYGNEITRKHITTLVKTEAYYSRVNQLGMTF